MNAVVIEAVDLLKNSRNEDVADDQHAAAIELAISLARLPKGTAIILKPDNNSHLTKILVRKPAQADYSILAYVHREQVVVAVDPFTAAAGDGV